MIFANGAIATLVGVIGSGIATDATTTSPDPSRLSPPM